MTDKLYVQDAYCRQFDAVVVSCEENKGRYEVILDRSCFYPEGGGQPGDRGVLVFDEHDSEIEAEVFDTHEKGEEIIHYCKSEVSPGCHVRGIIDWEHRFDLMQNHSGEHIVSGLLNKRFGCSNVGFHMGSDMITIDLDKEISWEELLETELQANQIIWNDEETQITIYGHEEAKDIQYRSKKEIPGDIRIVTFPGADTCACCGTHVKRTGEIGLIRILSVAKFHDGVRVEMLCGRRAFAYTQAISLQNKAISVLLSAKPLETAAAVSRMKDALTQEQYRAASMELKVFEQIAAKCEGKGNVLLLVKNYTADSVRKLAVAVMESCGNKCAVFSQAACEEDSAAGENDIVYEWKYAIGEKDGNVKELVAAVNQKLNGRGGGKPFFAQGSVHTSQAEIRKLMEDGSWTIYELTSD